MAQFSQLVLYAFFVLHGCFTLYNHILIRQYELNSEDDGKNIRSRRDIPNFNIFKGFSELKEHIFSESKLMQHEINKTLATIFRTIPSENFCRAVQKCNITTGKQGPPGPKGSPGKNGKRGAGLMNPVLQKSDMFHDANVTEQKIFTCTFSGNPVPIVTWTSNAAIVNISNEIDTENLTVRSSLTISHITWKDRGSITCLAESILGKDSGNGELNVHFPPRITLPTGPIYANIGSKIVFPECKVIAYPPSIIKWKKGYGQLPHQRAVSNNGYLNISKIHVEDDGFYVCSAENYLGKSTASIQFKSQSLHFIKKPEDFIQVPKDETINITCSATGFIYTEDIHANIFSFTTKKELENTTVLKTDDKITVSGSINKEGYYKCQITNNDKKIEATFLVEYLIAAKCPSITYGSAQGGTSYYEGVRDKQSCITKCKRRKKTDPTINGVFMQRSRFQSINYQSNCYCRGSMTSVRADHSYQTCLL